MIGNPKIIDALRRDLDALEIATVVRQNPQELVHEVSKPTKAVLIAPPVPDESVAAMCGELADSNPRIPVFTIIRSRLPWKAEKELYESGVTAVFSWPRERETLLQSLIGLVHVAKRESSDEPRDVMIERSARAQLKSLVELRGCRLRAQVVRGVVVLTGTVDHLWQVESAASVLRSIPGVQEVASETVRVRANATSDREISTAIRKLVRATSGIDLKTLALDVNDGHVVLAGTVDSPLELERTKSLVQHVRGVKSLKTFVTASSRARKRDTRLAHDVKKSLALRYPKPRVEVSAFGGIVVLRGTVDKAELRQAIRMFVATQPGVERVVDKMSVRRPPVPRNPG